MILNGIWVLGLAGSKAGYVPLYIVINKDQQRQRQNYNTSSSHNCKCPLKNSTNNASRAVNQTEESRS
eukprot:6108036-Amphidinium_carterae.1